MFVGVVLEGIGTYLNETRSHVDAAISDRMSRISGMEISPVVSYALGHGGKRLRPVISIMVGQALGSKREFLMDLAVAFEMLHTATLVHDDIIDGDEMRRNIQSINKRWGRDTAILAGDALISLAIKLSADYGPKVMTSVADYGMNLCNGEYIDISEDRNTAVDYYLRKIYLKSASLFKAATECAAIASSADADTIARLSRFGENFGMAYQIKDDMVDTSMNGEEAGYDLISGKITLPIVHLYNNASDSEKKIIKETFGQIRAIRDTVEKSGLAKKIFEMIDAAGSMEYCNKMLSGYVDKGIKELLGLPESAYKDYLIDMTGKIKSGEISP